MRSLVGNLSVVLLALAVAPSLGSATTSSEITKIHTSLDNLAAYAESYLQSRCSYLGGDCGGECSYAGCGSTFPTSDFECRSDFGTATCNGQCETRSMTKSALRMPLGTNFQDAETQSFACASHKLDTQFKAEFDSGSLKGWQYIADGYSGITRLYPGAPQGRTSGSCEDYDARLRPWYTAASSGPKDVVLVIDSSTSMQNCNDGGSTSGCQTRWAAVKNAVKSIFGTLTPNDFVATVTFSVTAKVLNSETSLIRAGRDTTTTTWANYQKKLDTVLLESKTNMAPGFTKAFDLLKSSTSDSSGCSKIILFLTDGDSTDVVGNLTGSLEAVQSEISAGQAALLAATGKNAHIFSYSMGTSTDTTIPKAVACDNKGVWAPIASGVDPLVAMRAYYQFLSSSISTKAVRWSAPYEDAFGLGTVVTAARPIYDYSQAVPLMVGVVATDILTSTLGGTSATVVNALISAGNSCPNLANLSTCQLQNLRNASNYECPGQVTSHSCYVGNDIFSLPKCSGVASMNNFLCKSVSTSTLLESPSKDNSAVLCSSSGSSSEEDNGNMGMIIGIVVGVVLGLALIGGIAAYCVMSPKKPSGEGSRRPTPKPQEMQNTGYPATTGYGGGREYSEPTGPATNMPHPKDENYYPTGNNANTNNSAYPTAPQYVDNNQQHTGPPPSYPAPPPAQDQNQYPAPPPQNQYPAPPPPQGQQQQQAPYAYPEPPKNYY